MHDAFEVIRWSDAGIDTTIISVLWSEAVAAEVMVFFLIGPALLNRFSARGAAALAAVAGIMRWSVAATTNSVMVLAFLQGGAAARASSWDALLVAPAAGSVYPEIRAGSLPPIPLMKAA
jgi:hypothetical protein